MSINSSLEEKILQTEKKLKEFSISIKQLDEQYRQLLQDLDLSPEELKEFAENPNHFPSVVWEELQNQKKEDDERLSRDFDCIRDPLKTKKKFSERGTVQQHWLFVR